MTADYRRKVHDKFCDLVLERTAGPGADKYRADPDGVYHEELVPQWEGKVLESCHVQKKGEELQPLRREVKVHLAVHFGTGKTSCLPFGPFLFTAPQRGW